MATQLHLSVDLLLEQFKQFTRQLPRTTPITTPSTQHAQPAPQDLVTALLDPTFFSLYHPTPELTTLVSLLEECYQLVITTTSSLSQQACQEAQLRREQHLDSLPIAKQQAELVRFLRNQLHSSKQDILRSKHLPATTKDHLMQRFKEIDTKS